MSGDSSTYDWLTDQMDGKEYDTWGEYAEDVTRLVQDKISELGKAQDWALQTTPEVLDQLGVSVKELETFAD